MALKVGSSGPDDVLNVPQAALVSTLVVTSFYKNSGMMYQMLDGENKPEQSEIDERDKLLNKVLDDSEIVVKVMELIDGIVKPKLEEAGFVYTPPADWEQKRKEKMGENSIDKLISAIMSGVGPDDDDDDDDELADQIAKTADQIAKTAEQIVNQEVASTQEQVASTEG
jgi:hypothetical protein